MELIQHFVRPAQPTPAAHSTALGTGSASARSYMHGCAMNRKIKRYGWIPDLPDQRDHLYAAPQPVLAKLPKKVDLRTKCPPVFNQGELGSCTANAIAAAHQFDQMKQNKPKAFTPSRLFIYYNERAMEGTVREDSGAMIRDGIKSLVKQGAAPETHMALCHQQVRRQTAEEMLRRGPEEPGPELPAPDAHPVATERLPRRRLPFRVRLLGIRKLRIGNRRAHRESPDAGRQHRKATRRPRRARRGL